MILIEPPYPKMNYSLSVLKVTDLFIMKCTFYIDIEYSLSHLTTSILYILEQ